MVYERVRGWTSGRSLPVQNFVKYPPPPTGYPQTFLRLISVIIMRNLPALCAEGHIEKEETKGRDAILEGSLSCLNVLLVHLCVHTLWFQRVC